MVVMVIVVEYELAPAVQVTVPVLVPTNVAPGMVPLPGFGGCIPTVRALQLVSATLPPVVPRTCLQYTLVLN